MTIRSRIWRSSVVIVLLASAGWHFMPVGHHGATKNVQIKATEFRFSPSRLTLRPGMYRFVLENRGRVLHNFEIQDPRAERAGRSDAAADEDHRHVAEVEAAPGRTATATIMLEPGTYRFMCHVRGHSAAGMTGRLIVSES